METDENKELLRRARRGNAGAYHAKSKKNNTGGMKGDVRRKPNMGKIREGLQAKQFHVGN